MLKHAHKYSQTKKNGLIRWLQHSLSIYLWIVCRTKKTRRWEEITWWEKSKRKKSRLSRAIDEKEKHVHCVSRKQQHASIVLKREMKWTETYTKKVLANRRICVNKVEMMLIILYILIWNSKRNHYIKLCSILLLPIN